MKNSAELKKIANINRKHIVDMVTYANNGHVGGGLSVCDLITVLYENEVDFNNVQRARVILSKGHAVPALYAALIEKGILKEESLKTFRHIDSKLQGHPYTCDVPEVDATTGLLGQGYSQALGMALAKKSNHDSNYVYAIAGDGEMQEGQIWEAMMAASHYKSDNLIFILDYNNLSSSHPVNEIINLESIKDKCLAFGLHVIEINGHDVDEILNAIEEAKGVKDKPKMIIAHTIKGKGVSFMENNPKWHSSGLTQEEYQIAMTELEKEAEALRNGI